MSIERKLAEKVMWAIHIDSQKEVKIYHKAYLRNIDLMEEIDTELRDRVCLAYANYQVEKARQDIKKWSEE